MEAQQHAPEPQHWSQFLPANGQAFLCEVQQSPQPGSTAAMARPAAMSSLPELNISQQQVQSIAKELHGDINDHQDSNKVLRTLAGLSEADRLAVEKYYDKNFGHEKNPSLSLDNANNKDTLYGDINKNFGKIDQLRIKDVLGTNGDQANYAGDAAVLLEQVKEHKKGADANLVSYLSTLNYTQIHQLESSYQSEFGKSFQKEVNDSGSAGLKEAMPLLMKGSDWRNAQDDISLARMGVEHGGRDGLALVQAALGSGTEASDQARAAMQRDSLFKDDLQKTFKGNDLAAANDFLQYGQIQMATIIRGDAKDKSHIQDTLLSASPDEREMYAVGQEYAKNGQQPSDPTLKQAVDFYNNLHSALEKQGDGKQVSQWENTLLTGQAPPDAKKGGKTSKPDDDWVNGLPAQSELAQSMINHGDYSGKTEDLAGLQAMRARQDFVEQLRGANAAYQDLSPDQVQSLHHIVSMAQTDYDASRKQYDQDHPGFWKQAISIAADVAIAAGAVLLAPESGGASLAIAGARLAASGAFYAIAEGVKSEAIDGSYNWSFGNLLKQSVLGMGVGVIGKFVPSAALNRLGAAAAERTVAEVGTTLGEDGLDSAASSSLKAGLSKLYGQAAVTAREPGLADIEKVVARSLPDASQAETRQISQMIEKNFGEHLAESSRTAYVRQMSEMFGSDNSVAAAAKLKAFRYTTAVGANVGISLLAAPLRGNFTLDELKSIFSRNYVAQEGNGNNSH